MIEIPTLTNEVKEMALYKRTSHKARYGVLAIGLAIAWVAVMALIQEDYKNINQGEISSWGNIIPAANAMEPLRRVPNSVVVPSPHDCLDGINRAKSLVFGRIQPQPDVYAGSLILEAELLCDTSGAQTMYYLVYLPWAGNGKLNFRWSTGQEFTPLEVHPY